MRPEDNLRYDILNGEGREGQGGVFTGDAGKVAFAFLAMVEESSGVAPYSTRIPR
jgi:hypothetical protein